ncbi:MAG: AcrB/AcrD/AcrF family protein [Candidatus Omnitrophica bacterium]|nr:AcrB/AcrD/AcrF family protein [Candidatus Omnitrophota bacterium]
MSLPKFSVNNSIFVNMISVIILIIGGITLMGMNREVFPNVSFDIVSISTYYAGATPLDVEKLITVPIEKELQEVDGIKEVNSTSASGASVIFVKLDPDEPDKDTVIRDIQSAVDKVRDLPEDVEDPVVTEIDSKQYPIVEVALSGDMSERRLREYADVLEDLIEDIKGVSKVTKDGYRDREMQIMVDPQKMKARYVSIDEIEAALARRNISLPAGKLDTATTEYNIRTTGEFEDPEEIEDVIIRANDAGNWLRIRDVGRVVDGFKEETVITKSWGSRSINLIVMKKGSGDAITIVDEVKEVCAAFLEKIPDELKISYINDYSFYARRRLNVLMNNAWVGLALVIGIMLVFLQKRMALLTVLGIPISFFATFIVMGAMGVTINLISMFGLIVVLGMLVDDGIIVAENAYRYIEEGMEPRKAAVKGAEEVMGAVTSAILTTIAAFSPLLFMTGIIGKFIRNIPTVVIIALIASLGEALVILPSHIADFVKVRTDASGKPVGMKKDLAWFKALIKFYTGVVEGAIKHRYKVVAGFIGVLAVALFFAFNVLKFILFPAAGINFFFIRGEAPIGTPLYRTNELIAPVEDIVSGMSDEELDAYVTTVGSIAEDRNDPFSGKASNLVQVTVYLTQEQDRERNVTEIIDELREKTRDIEGFDDLRFDIPETGPPVGKAVEAKIRGEDFEVLDRIAHEYMDYLNTIEGTTDVTWDHKPGKEEIRVKVDHDKAAMAGLSIGQIASTVRAVFEGGIATKIKPVKAEEETDVTVMFDKEETHDMSVFNEIYVANSYGKLIPLNKVSTIKKVPSTTNIHHLDGKRVVTASANVDTDKTTSLEVNAKLKEKFRGIPDRYIGYSVKYGGEQEETVESLVSLLKAFFFAFLVVYLILSSFFKSVVQPLVVMLAIPFGLIGVVVAFLAHGIPISFLAILGVVSLNGIVVNDSIVLVDFINKLRREGAERRESIIKAGQMRLRPVILTTVTTAGGLSTVAYGIGGKDPFLVPMALALCWGLVFATLLTLVIIPCIYSIIDDFAMKVLHRSSMIRCERMENGKCEEYTDSG